MHNVWFGKSELIFDQIELLLNDKYFNFSAINTLRNSDVSLI